MKNILIIAGSDSVGGAGIQADIKTCEAFGCYCATAITAITAQNTNGVSGVLAVTPEILDTQLKMINDELYIDAVKIGMLFNAELIKIVKVWLEHISSRVPIVIDPVCVAKSGAKLLRNDALNELKELLNFATIATPNLDEAKILNLDFNNLPCDILLKRTSLSEICEDSLFYKDGKIIKFQDTLLKPNIMHGAGCSFSSAIACGLALKNELEDSIKNAKKFITNSIKHAHKTNFGVRLLNHAKGHL
ncbi:MULTISPECIES: bifunctional hydroxymethylpyrimidine kinase/phosphomethylpyrimidine kinase [unclassified Campylobacter]|uniref:bifunctional hydroxymethylpyrimidine kinase/phosphomethylpyrimidine kinase n=1 Tax=unclassified Campylobacter TaxID=2593542 RepID=UPI003D33651C